MKLASFFVKRFLITFLAALALPNPIFSAEINCNSPVWKNKAVCNKKKAKLKEPKFCKNENLTAIQKEECLNYKKYLKAKNEKKPPKYPVIFYEFNPTEDPELGKNVWKFWASDNKEQLDIAFTKGIYDKKREKRIIKTLHTIPKNRIISYQQSLIDMSDNAAQLATNVGITAVVFPLGALFQGVNYKKMEIYKWEITFIDEYGREKKQILYPVSTVPVADRYYTFLPDFTGLKNGEKRTEESLRGLYLDGINRFEEKIEKDFNDLSFFDESNNCKILNKEKYPLSTNIFLEEKKQFDLLREKFNLEPYSLKEYCK